MSILTSVSKGFGFSIGRKMADNVINGISQSSGEYKQSPSLSGKQILKTIMWSFGMVILSSFISSFVLAFELVSSNGAVILGVVLTILGTYVIGRGYYNDNKQVIDSVNRYNELQKEKERLINETEDKYINKEITKRERDVLLRRISKL